MFNFVNGNPFNKKIESALSTGQENKRQNQQQRDEERKYLEEDDNDEVTIAQRPVLTEDDVLYLVREYIGRLKSEHADNEKTQQKLDKFLSGFDVKKFMKQNPDMTAPEFNMIMFNETSELINRF